MKKTLTTIGIILLIVLAILALKYFLCKNSKDKVLGASGNGTSMPAQDLLNAAKPCKFFSLS